VTAHVFYLIRRHKGPGTDLNILYNQALEPAEVV